MAITSKDIKYYLAHCNPESNIWKDADGKSLKDAQVVEKMGLDPFLKAYSEAKRELQDLIQKETNAISKAICEGKSEGWKRICDRKCYEIENDVLKKRLYDKANQSKREDYIKKRTKNYSERASVLSILLRTEDSAYRRIENDEIKKREPLYIKEARIQGYAAGFVEGIMETWHEECVMSKQEQEDGIIYAITNDDCRNNDMPIFVNAIKRWVGNKPFKDRKKYEEEADKFYEHYR